MRWNVELSVVDKKEQLIGFARAGDVGPPEGYDCVETLSVTLEQRCTPSPKLG